MKDIEEENFTDSQIIDKIESLLEQNGIQFKKSLIEAHTGYDNFSLLHYAAKTCRSKLTNYFIENLSMGNF